MGTKHNPRRKGTGGLYIRKTRAWNEVKQAFEVVEMFQASKEINDPAFPDKRKRITGTGRTVEEANARLNRSMERYFKNKGLESLGLNPKTRTTGSGGVTAYLQQWHSEMHPTAVSPQLKLKYWQHCKNHIIPHIGTIPLSALTYQDLQELFYVTLPGKRKIKGGVETGDQLLGNNALLNIYKTLNMALNVAVKKGKIPRNPLGLVKAPAYKAPEENVPQAMHIVESMFKKMQETNDPAFDHFILALLGLRRGERLGLTFSNVKLKGENPKIVIKNQLARVTGQGLFLKPATKNGRERVVTLQDPWLSALKRLEQKRKEQKKLPGFQPSAEFQDLVFLKDNGKPFDLNEDNELWLKVNETYYSKNKHLRGHLLRHVSATFMADNNVSVEVARAVLGHESESMAHYYRRVTAKQQQNQVAQFGSALSEKINPKN